MSIVNDPIDEDEQYEMDGAFEHEEEYPLATAIGIFLMLMGGALLVSLAPAIGLALIAGQLFGAALYSAIYG